MTRNREERGVTGDRERGDGKKDWEEVRENQLPYAYWLYKIPKLGSKTIAAVRKRVDSLEMLYHMSEEELEKVLPETAGKQKLAARIAETRRHWNLQEEYERLCKKGIGFTCLGHKNYPDSLSKIPDPPFGLYYRGKLPDRKRPLAAIIGARNCSEYGRRMAEIFGRELALSGVGIISGMARGIDGIGQYAALKADGYSMGVMGCGADICYPLENRMLYDMLIERGGICSEYHPGTEPKSHLFPPRNRIISGLSDIVLVMEAKERSGTLITVDTALEQGKEVYALPGRITESLSVGCNRLIQQGANVAISPQELIRDLTGKMVQADATLLVSDIEREILQNLDVSPQSVENIRERMLLNSGCQMSLQELMEALIRLTLNGLATQIGSNYFMKG